MALRVTAQRVTRSIPQLTLKRGMATEKQIFLQIQSTKNIRKITESMKNVSAAKLKGDENRLKVAIPFNSWTTALCGEPKLAEDATYDELPAKNLIVGFTTDRGLCGGVNTYISKTVRECIDKLKAQDKEGSVVVFGDKGRQQMKRRINDSILRAATDIEDPGTFSLACALASELVAAGAADYDAVVLIYNSYVNAAVYKQRYKVIKPFVGDGDEESMSAYEFEPDTKSEVIQDLYEYMLTSQIYHSFMDGKASEQSARMAAMENATKNAGEMIDSLTLQYNRARQARITTELIEIISGASAIEES